MISSLHVCPPDLLKNIQLHVQSGFRLVFGPGINLLLVYDSVSQPVCRDVQVCRKITLGVPPNLKMLKKVIFS
jgi:hypothetical protein